MPGSIGDQFNVSVPNDQVVAIKAMFPTTNKFKMLQMIGEVPHSARPLLTGLGVIRRRWKLNEINKVENFDVLEVWQEEWGLNGVSLDRKGRLELAEIVASRRLPEKDDTL